MAYSSGVNFLDNFVVFIEYWSTEFHEKSVGGRVRAAAWPAVKKSVSYTESAAY
jgi:hypothetical protein